MFVTPTLACINSTLLIVHGTWADLEIPQNYQKNLKIMCCFLYKNKVTILVWCDVTSLICDVTKCSLVKLVVRLITNCMFVAFDEQACTYSKRRSIKEKKGNHTNTEILMWDLKWMIINFHFLLCWFLKWWQPLYVYYSLMLNVLTYRLMYPSNYLPISHLIFWNITRSWQ